VFRLSREGHASAACHKGREGVVAGIRLMFARFARKKPTVKEAMCDAAD
jgi:hypothetical protein